MIFDVFKPQRPLHRFPQEQLIYSTLEIDLLLIISGLTMLFELALLLAVVIDLHFHLCRFKLSKSLPQNSHTVNAKKSIITHLEIISVLA